MINVLYISDIQVNSLQKLLSKYKLELRITSSSEEIPGSYWGDSEAGLINNQLFVRNDTPLHSALHEACHFICMDRQRRENLDTNAEGDYDEENAVCYLQILLADEIPELGRLKMMSDMDEWGYTFRLGSAKNWFEKDAEDALEWLVSFHLLDSSNQPNYQLRQ
ncbi:hypothetical protein OO007_17020 [Cocleimonas sp. KMM 6892]|nr:hypothetical protein [Cocleimonas sp. KMM 6892]MEC4716754.1 hypothetical protein [Cocleimonas sp. KMM 6895]MEC4746091.1 hypothetical protein [Cocleimonas sp. KMM 6896]